MAKTDEKESFLQSAMIQSKEALGCSILTAVLDYFVDQRFQGDDGWKSFTDINNMGDYWDWLFSSFHKQFYTPTWCQRSLRPRPP